MSDQTFHFYAIELEDAVWDAPTFRKRNPARGELPAVYVGKSRHEPACRFTSHKAERDAPVPCICGRFRSTKGMPGKFAHEFGIRPRPDILEAHGLPLSLDGTEQAAQRMEKRTANRLLAEGYGVWSDANARKHRNNAGKKI